MIIKAARPNISDNSIKQYMSSLRTLNGGAAVPITNADSLENFDEVMEKLKAKKPTTIKNYMNAHADLCHKWNVSIVLFLGKNGEPCS